MTLEDLAETSGVSVSTISQIENRKQGYTQNTLNALADALGCEPGDLLSVTPGVDDALRVLWKKLSDQDRERWLRSLRAFVED